MHSGDWTRNECSYPAHHQNRGCFYSWWCLRGDAWCYWYRRRRPWICRIGSISTTAPTDHHCCLGFSRNFERCHLNDGESSGHASGR